MRMKIRLILVGLLVMTGTGFSLTGFAAEIETKVSTSSATARGATPAVLFQKYCSICHGETGNGKTRVVRSMDPKPRDFTAAEAARVLTRERMIESVTNGRPGTAMVGHKRKLSATEIASIVDYIRSTFMQKAGPEKQATTLAPGNVARSATVAVTKNLRGQRIFKKHCSQCHGDRGSVAVWAKSGLIPAPRDFTAAKAKQELTLERMIKSVTDGRSGTAMMPFTSRLSSGDILAVVSYIRSEFMQLVDGGANVSSDSGQTNKAAAAATVPTPVSGEMPDQHAKVDMSAGMPGGISGDLEKGRDFYMDNCYVCHGKKGDGKGPRSHFISPHPRNFTSESSRQIYSRPRLFDAIQKGKRGTVMPAWGKVLDDQQIANVAEFVFKEFVSADISTDKSAEKKEAVKDTAKDTNKDKSSKLEDVFDEKKKAGEIAVTQTKKQTLKTTMN